MTPPWCYWLLLLFVACGLLSDSDSHSRWFRPRPQSKNMSQRSAAVCSFVSHRKQPPLPPSHSQVRTITATREPLIAAAAAVVVSMGLRTTGMVVCNLEYKELKQGCVREMVLLMMIFKKDEVAVGLHSSNNNNNNDICVQGSCVAGQLLLLIGLKLLFLLIDHLGANVCHNIQTNRGKGREGKERRERRGGGRERDGR